MKSSSVNIARASTVISPSQRISPSATPEEDRIFKLVADLTNPHEREHALAELSKIRESYENMALLLWHSFGVMTVLLQEVLSIYPLLHQPTMTATASTRVCNALALMQCIASHTETRPLFINAQFPLYLYPILNTVSKSRPFEYLRLTSLGIIGALVKNDNPEVISFLISTEIIPLCLHIMEEGNELCKTVAIFILQKTLLDENGLDYICQTYERFFAVVTVLNSMTLQLKEHPSNRLLKHIVRCYLRLSDNTKGKEALKQVLPEPLKDGYFSSLIGEDAATKRCISTLFQNLEIQ